ncbi:MAG: hypothetical protein R3F43_00535 [bacterium]
MATTEQGPGAIPDRRGGPPPRRGGPWLVGVGEAFRLGDGPGRVIALLLTRPTPCWQHRRPPAPAGAPIRIAGRLLAGHQTPRAGRPGPDQRFQDVAVRVQGDRFEADIPAEESGTIIAELIAEGPSGPTPLTQLSFHVDEELPVRLETAWPAPDQEGDPADQAANLLNADRALRPAPADPGSRPGRRRARALRVDMRAHGFRGAPPPHDRACRPTGWRPPGMPPRRAARTWPTTRPSPTPRPACCGAWATAATCSPRTSPWASGGARRRAVVRHPALRHAPPGHRRPAEARATCWRGFKAREAAGAGRLRRQAPPGAGWPRPRRIATGRRPSMRWRRWPT